ncbi:hypothetical protein BD769DRAFT_1597692 [Suillus cothurnatus]|nr:hypothetical protein BD769DRAFT_1597692 [Suillus cothurnatus]
MPSQVIQAGPPSQIFPLGNCDAVIVQSSHGDQTGKIYFMQLHITNCGLCSKSYCASASYLPAIPPCHATLPHYLADQPLIYVQYYEVVGHSHDQPAISMYMVARKYHNGPGSQRMRLGAVIPLTDVMHAVELIPVYGKGTTNHRVGAETSMEVYERFYLNNFSDKEVYHTLCSDLH